MGVDSGNPQRTWVDLNKPLHGITVDVKPNNVAVVRLPRRYRQTEADDLASLLAEIKDSGIDSVVFDLSAMASESLRKLWGDFLYGMAICSGVFEVRYVGIPQTALSDEEGRTIYSGKTYQSVEEALGSLERE